MGPGAGNDGPAGGSAAGGCGADVDGKNGAADGESVCVGEMVGVGAGEEAAGMGEERQDVVIQERKRQKFLIFSQMHCC